MKLEFPFSVDKLTLNNRVYSKSLMLGAIQKYKQDYISVNRSYLYEGYNADITSLICPITDIEICEDGRIEATIDETINPNHKDISIYLNKSMYIMSPVGTGKLSISNKEDGHLDVLEYDLRHLSMIPIPATAIKI